MKFGATRSQFYDAQKAARAKWAATEDDWDDAVRRANVATVVFGVGIAAVVLGGASLFGGRGSVVGTLLGAALIQQILNWAQMVALWGSLGALLAGAADVVRGDRIEAQARVEIVDVRGVDVALEVLEPVRLLHHQARLGDLLDRQRALEEAIGAGGLTTMSTVSPDAEGVGHFRAKRDCVVAGLFLLEKIFSLLEAHVQVRCRCRDGEEVTQGTVVAEATVRLLTRGAHRSPRSMICCQ